MGFWSLNHPLTMSAAINARTGKTWSYADLRSEAARMRALFPQSKGKQLGLLVAQNRYECLAAYVAALQSGTALALLDANLNPALLNRFVEIYRPDWIFKLAAGSDFSGYRSSACDGLFCAKEPIQDGINPETAILLSTSGSTGSPKMVRLSYANIQANAASIAEYLALTADERPITSLPMAYSYGLSVVNSHLHAGAAIVLSEDAVMRKEFWDAVDSRRCTSFAGVPYTYQALLAMGLLKSKGPTLKTLTQAGGRLEGRYIEQMCRIAVTRGWKFIVMYGQTEAAPRISYVPFEALAHKIGSIGIPVPGGALETDPDTGELIYSGPNVMLGYAESRADLAKGDETQGILRTGDLARQDPDGYFYITGRLKRFLKLFGKRFNLDEVESILARQTDAALACYGCDDLLTIAVEKPGNPDSIARAACEIFDLARAAVKAQCIETLPRNANGKIDYQQLLNGLN